MPVSDAELSKSAPAGRISDEEARETAISLWRNINLVNLHANILPTKLRASLILGKGADHQIESVALRKL